MNSREHYAVESVFSANGIAATGGAFAKGHKQLPLTFPPHRRRNLVRIQTHHPQRLSRRRTPKLQLRLLAVSGKPALVISQLTIPALERKQALVLVLASRH